MRSLSPTWVKTGPAPLTWYSGCAAGGIRADLDHCGRSLKAQFKYANKTGAPLTAVIGDEEAAAGNVKIKNMASGEEALVSIQDACEKVRAMIGQERK